MLKHVVAWKFKESAESAAKEENLHHAKALLEGLKDKITEIKSLEVGIDTMKTKQSYDLVLESEFDNVEALLVYQTHPEHVKVGEFLRKVQQSRIVVDYEHS
jgi:hypothetical protein